MNYLFRPTPVVVLGRDRGVDGVALSKPPAGVMGGTPHPSGRPSRSLATQGAPWIVRSGSMSSFGTLGQDFSVEPSTYDPTIDLAPPPDFAPDFGPGFDYSGAFGSPNLPAAVPPDFPVAPDLGAPTFAPINLGLPGPLPPSGAGPTGRSIPGTQPVNPVTAGVSAGTGLLSAIANFFKPSAPKGYAALPGAGVNPRQAAPSFWTGSTILPGTPNTTVIIGGLAAVVFLFALSSGGKK